MGSTFKVASIFNELEPTFKVASIFNELEPTFKVDPNKEYTTDLELLYCASEITSTEILPDPSRLFYGGS
jgi:hypothetical protein